MKAVVIRPGQVGCGFAGHLLRRPVTVIAFTNHEHAGRLLRNAVERLAGPGVVERHGFSGAVIDRATAHRIIPEHPDAPMLLISEPVYSFIIDGTALGDGGVSSIPEIVGMTVWSPGTDATRGRTAS